MARSSSNALATMLLVAGVGELAIYVFNYMTLKGGGTTVLPFDLLGALFGYPGLSVQPVSVTAQYAYENPTGYAPAAPGSSPSFVDEIESYLSEGDAD
jgi:hypothetical protein